MDWEDCRETLISWMAGFFDGEGCVSVIKRNHDNVFTLVVQVVTTDLLTMKMIQTAFKGVLTARKPQEVNHKFSWEWRLTGRKAKEFLELIYPYSITKRKEIEVALKYPHTKSGHRISASTRNLREELREELQKLKKLNPQDVDFSDPRLQDLALTP